MQNRQTCVFGSVFYSTRFGLVCGFNELLMDECMLTSTIFLAPIYYRLAYRQNELVALWRI